MRFLRHGLCVFLSITSFCYCAYSESLVDCYPLKNGNSWVYEREDGAIIKEEVATGGDACLPQLQAVKIVRSDGSYMCLSVDSEGVKLHKDFDDYDTNIYPEPLMLVPFDIEDKRGYKREQEYAAQSENEVLEGLISYEIQFIGREDVVVPAGEFADCVKILTTSSWNDRENCGEDETFYWLARGIGMVKKVSESVEVDRNRKLDVYTTYEEFKLREAIVDGKVYGEADEE